mgnify:CR=1 FL=1
MAFLMSDSTELSIDITQTVEINASPEEAWRSLIRRLSVENSTPDNQPMPMVLEERPGGRWFRDLGDDQGHLWGFVQVIKPPRLLEIHGPMFMSCAVAGHIQLRVTPTDSGCELSLRHRVLGFVGESHRQGLTHGWTPLLERTKQFAEDAG